MKDRKPVEIRKWVWRSYLRSALIPIIIIEMIFFIVNFSTHAVTINTMRNYLTTQVNEELTKASSQDAENIEQQLQGIAQISNIYAQQAGRALNTDAPLREEDEQRLTYSPAGAYYTAEDSGQGGAAVFYSGFVPVGEAGRKKAARVLQTQQLMEDIQTQHPLIASVYLNTYDSLNVIYPYFDVISQYSEGTDITTFNFYYEADQTHNPDRSVEWTDVYLDPAGHGWTASCIAPVYKEDSLEGVVGLDVTVGTITQQVLDLDIPWDGYAMLVGSDGTILALPENGERDWGLSELTEHHYAQAIMEDTFKPSEFNLSTMKNLSSFASDIVGNVEGLSPVILNGQKKVVSWNTITETGWKLLFVVPESTIYAGVTQISSNETRSGIIVISSLLVFYLLFFISLYKRSKTLSYHISSPLLAINNMVKKIGLGEYYQNSMDFGVAEFMETSDYIVEMGKQLGKSNTELLNTQEVLRSREAYLQALVNSIDDVILEVDENGVFHNVRTSDVNNLALNYTEGSTHTVASILNESEAAAYLEVIRGVILTGKPDSIEYQLETPLGMRWFQARIALIGDGSGTVAVSARDITERKEMERKITEARIEAENASQSKSQFLSNMSHELRTPLNAVLGFAQVLEIDPESPLNESQKECVHEIKKAGGHLLELINEVLDLAKIESGRVSISIEPVLVSQIVDETLALVRPMAEKNGVEMVSNYTRCNRYIKADKIRIKQVLINLMSNAIKYNKENGKVTFYCDPHDGNVRFHVIDTGIGIPEDELEEIFKPFNRLNATKNLVEGTGIGLTMVKQLTEMMHGSVHVESKLNEGSHFYIEIPETSMEELDFEHLPIKPECFNKAEPAQYRHKLLYVEDNPANLNLVQRIVSYIPDIELLSASSAEVGIDIARAHHPDLILLDINLPGMDGYQMFKRLRRYSETKDIPVIAISANAMEKDINEAKRLGFTDYLTKPIDVPVFIQKLEEYFKSDN